MAAIDKLTRADVLALASYASQVGGGVRWKGKLRNAWETGVYYVDPETRAHLQNLRNRLGTSWLTKFQFAGDDYASESAGEDGECHYT